MSKITINHRSEITLEVSSIDDIRNLLNGSKLTPFFTDTIIDIDNSYTSINILFQDITYYVTKIKHLDILTILQDNPKYSNSELTEPGYLFVDYIHGSRFTDALSVICYL